VDGWGVDFGLLDARGALLANPVHYRDARTDGMLEEAFVVVPREEIFEQTGIQFLPINSLYQLLALARTDDPSLHLASTFLTIPDLLNYWLTGEKVAEFTNATTTQCLNPRTRTWAEPLLGSLGIPRHIFPEVQPPGSLLGALLDESGAASPTRVVLAGSHDTASAVAGTPLTSAAAAYISSGTWSLVGVEIAEPAISAATLALNLTNEGGVARTFRLLRNVMGLWLVQGIRRSVERMGSTVDYAELTAQATAATPLQAVIDPDAPEFLRAHDMANAIRAFCRASQQSPPEDTGGLVRTALESLALRYRWVIEHLEEVIGHSIHVIHIVGGGARNRLLCQMTADATGRTVLAGPAEATALGNLVVQAIAAHRLDSLAEARALIARSFPPLEYIPVTTEGWEESYARFCEVAHPHPAMAAAEGRAPSSDR
jgi:rhamnulokinase